MGWGDKSDNTLRVLSKYLREGKLEEFKRGLSEKPEFLTRPDGSDAWLEEAAKSGWILLGEFLLSMGLGVNVVANLKVQAVTPLWISASKGHLEFTNWLLDHGAHVNLPLFGQMTCFPLFNAASEGHLDVVKLLIDRGANTDFVWRGSNVLMEAATYGQEEVVDYLQSVGLRDLRETTPPDYPTSHKELLEIVVEKHGQLGDWTAEIPGQPNVVVRVAGPKEPGKPKCLFTIGLSDIKLEINGGGVMVTELIVPLPAEWPLDPQSQREVRWNWPLRELERIVDLVRSTRTWPHAKKAIFHGDPPQPLVAGSKLSSWAALCPTESHQFADYRIFDLHLLFPVYPEEVALILREEEEELQKRFQAHGIPQWIDPIRPNMV